MAGLGETARRLRAGIGLSKTLSPRLAAIEADAKKPRKRTSKRSLGADSSRAPADAHPARRAGASGFSPAVAQTTARLATGAFSGLAAGAAALGAYAFFAEGAARAPLGPLTIGVGSGLFLTAALATLCRRLAGVSGAARGGNAAESQSFVPETAVPFAHDAAGGRLDAAAAENVDPDWRRRGGQQLRFVDAGFPAAPKRWRADPHLGPAPSANKKFSLGKTGAKRGLFGLKKGSLP